MIHSTIESPATRAARAAHRHRRLQIVAAFERRVRKAWTTGHPATRETRTAYVFAQYADALAAHDAQAPAEQLAVA